MVSQKSGLTGLKVMFRAMQEKKKTTEFTFNIVLVTGIRLLEFYVFIWKMASFP